MNKKLEKKHREAERERDKALDKILCEGKEAHERFAGVILRAAFVSEGGGKIECPEDCEDDNVELLLTAGTMLALVHPSCVFGACMGLMSEGGMKYAKDLVQSGEETDHKTASTMGYLTASKIISNVLRKTRYWNAEELCSCMKSIPNLMDDQRIHDDLSGVESDGFQFRYDFEEGTVEIRDE
jgi:hypothetical protein